MPQQRKSPTRALPKNSRTRVWAMIVVAALTLTGAAAGLSYVWNHDIFWHLASGEWMLDNARVLGTDPFSIDPEPQWINVHWLFQLIVAVLHRMGGFELLSVLKAALSAAALLVFALALRRRVARGWLIVCGLAMLPVMDDRLRVRPEIFTLVFLILTIVLIEHVRRGGRPERLWWLVPLMLVWANMHGLYVLGLGLVWSTVLGALVDRALGRSVVGEILTQKALVPIVAGTVAVLISPWPVTSAAQPLLLWTRISGQTAYYTYAVAELRPGWDVFWRFPAALGLLVAAGAAMIANRRAVPLAHVVWVLAFAALGGLAIRNVGLIGPVGAYLLAAHGGDLIKKLAARPRLGRLGPIANAAAVILAGAVAVGYATGLTYRIGGTQKAFGAGLREEHYPIKTAEFLRNLSADGDVLCANFGDAGVFIYHCYPRRRLYMDGRLEAHSLERFIRQHRIYNALRTARTAGSVELPDEVRFIIIRSNNRQHLQALTASDRFKLIYIDPAAVCFARLDFPGGWARTKQLPDKPNLDQFDLPLDVLVRQTTRRRTWYRQSVQSRRLNLGELFLSLAGPEIPSPQIDNTLRRRCALLAMRYCLAAGTDGAADPQLAAGREAEAWAVLARLTKTAPEPVAPVDIDTARALYLFEHLDTGRLSRTDRVALALQRIRTMLQGRQLDAASEAMVEFMESLPPAQRVNPPDQYVKVRNMITDQLATSRVRLHAKNVADLPIRGRVEAMTSDDVGLVQMAIAQLRSAGRLSAEETMLLGDLLLGMGRTDQARQTYDRVKLPQAEQWRLKLREALCDWAEGKLSAAANVLADLTAPHRPVAQYYHAAIGERLGRSTRAPNQ